MVRNIYNFKDLQKFFKIIDNLLIIDNSNIMIIYISLSYLNYINYKCSDRI